MGLDSDRGVHCFLSVTSLWILWNSMKISRNRYDTISLCTPILKCDPGWFKGFILQNMGIVIYEYVEIGYLPLTRFSSFKTLTSILTAVKECLQPYHDTFYSRCSINSMWILNKFERSSGDPQLNNIIRIQ